MGKAGSRAVQRPALQLLLDSHSLAISRVPAILMFFCKGSAFKRKRLPVRGSWRQARVTACTTRRRARFPRHRAPAVLRHRRSSWVISPALVVLRSFYLTHHYRAVERGRFIRILETTILH